MSLKTPSSLLDPRLIATAEKLLLLGRTIQKVLSPEYQEGLFVSQFTAGKLTLITNNAVKRIGIIGEMECKLRTGFILDNQKVVKVEVKVIPQTRRSEPPPPQPLAELSARTAKGFSLLAEKETEPTLKKALEKIAKRAKK